MLSPFEATLIGILAQGPASRYDVMKLIQKQSLYWAGSSGAVYSAIERLEDKGMLQVQPATHPPIYEVTEKGFTAGYEFLRTVVPAEKLVLDPALVRLRIRGLQSFSPNDRITYYKAQLSEYAKAKQSVREREKGFTGNRVLRRLSNLAISQLELEEDFIQTLLDEELAQQDKDE